jgi:serine/threonine protein kinase
MTDTEADMTHGDIKPQNVLVFRDKSGAIFAKLADFGYSGWDMLESEKILIKPPRSRPWDAPEYHHHGFSVAKARLLDIFSFGMLCMWIMFEDKLHSGTFIPLESPEIECASLTVVDYSRVFSDQNFTDELKHEGKLLKLARQLTGTAKTSTNAQKERLLRFFDSTLAYDPGHRAWNLEELGSLLSPDWYVWISVEFHNVQNLNSF